MIGMRKITLDHSTMAFFERHPVIRELKKMDGDKKIRLYHHINLDRDLESMSKTEEKIYDRLREMVFGEEQKHLNLMEHGDLCLLINHMKNKRDFFLTLDVEKYRNLGKHRDLRIRFPDEQFLREVRKPARK